MPASRARKAYQTDGTMPDQAFLEALIDDVRRAAKQVVLNVRQAMPAAIRKSPGRRMEPARGNVAKFELDTWNAVLWIGPALAEAIAGRRGQLAPQTPRLPFLPERG